MTNYDKYVAKQMKNEEFRKEYEATLKRIAMAMGKQLRISFV